MKEQLITEITRKMLPYLDNSQMEQLQEVLTHCFWGVQISPFIRRGTVAGKRNQ